jgi:hypothetical protein
MRLSTEHADRAVTMAEGEAIYIEDESAVAVGRMSSSLSSSARLRQAR